MSHNKRFIFADHAWSYCSNDEAEVSQVMDVAEAMLKFAELAVGAPVIMHGNALVMGQDVFGSHPDMSASVMHVVVGQFFCAGHVQPRQRALRHASTLCIEMDHSAQQSVAGESGPGSPVVCMASWRLGGKYRIAPIAASPYIGGQQLSR